MIEISSLWPLLLIISYVLRMHRFSNFPPPVSLLIRQEVRGGNEEHREGWQGIFHDIWWGKWVMLGVAVLLASSSMAAIELITLYARLDNAVHKMAPPPSPPISPCVCSALATEKTCALLLKNLNLRLLFFSLFMYSEQWGDAALMQSQWGVNDAKTLANGWKSKVKGRYLACESAFFLKMLWWRGKLEGAEITDH